MASSPARIRANRNNARKSTGPSTLYGKARVKYNALKHGLSAKALILPWEDATEFHVIRGGLFEHYQPQTPVECFLVDQVAQHWWRINRSRAFETKMMSKFESQDPSRHPEQSEIENFRRYDTGIDRAFHRNLEQLERTIRRRPILDDLPASTDELPEPAEAVSEPNPAASGPEPAQNAQLSNVGFVSQKSIVPSESTPKEAPSRNEAPEPDCV